MTTKKILLIVLVALLLCLMVCACWFVFVPLPGITNAVKGTLTAQAPRGFTPQPTTNSPFQPTQSQSDAGAGINADKRVPETVRVGFKTVPEQPRLGTWFLLEVIITNEGSTPGDLCYVSFSGDVTEIITQMVSPEKMYLTGRLLEGVHIVGTQIPDCLEIPAHQQRMLQFEVAAPRVDTWDGQVTVCFGPPERDNCAPLPLTITVKE